MSAASELQCILSMTWRSWKVHLVLERHLSLMQLEVNFMRPHKFTRLVASAHGIL